MSRGHLRSRLPLLGAACCLLALAGAGCGQVSRVEESAATKPSVAGGGVAIRVAAATNEDPGKAGREAAQRLNEALAGEDLKAVLISECFEGEGAKERAIKGVQSVLAKDLIFGLATYGSFSQEGCGVRDSVTLLGIAGAGVSVSFALQRDLGVAGLSWDESKSQIETQLTAAGRALASKLRRTACDRLLIILADAHSPKNAPFVRGVQEVVGKGFAITGGCANKNQGQTFVYYQGRMYPDSAVAIMLSGNLKVSLAGRKAKENAKVISTARESATESLAGLAGRPLAALAFDCAGRKGKLTNIEDELGAIQQSLGKAVPLFGCYCAGEIGPPDIAVRDPSVLSSGEGWHVMFTALSMR